MQRLEEWASNYPAAFTGQDDIHKQAFKAATWAPVCSWPGSSLEEHMPPARYLVAFFILDDLAEDELKSFVHSIECGDPCGGAKVAAMFGLYRDILPRKDADSVWMGHRRSFERSFLRMCKSMMGEMAVDSSVVDEQTLLTLRRDTIAVEPFLHVWLACKGFAVSLEEARAMDRLTSLRRLAVDMVILGNDLVGLEHDEAGAHVDPKAADMNLILVRRRTLGGRGAAIDSVVRTYNGLVDAFEENERRVREQGVHISATLEGYIQLLKNNVNGNIQGSVAVAEIRYPGASKYVRNVRALG
ncbi:MAG: terpene synthase family protein [Myxococcota bacterium]